MKANYEDVSRYRLTRRTPVIIRIDGKAFHTFTRHCEKPLDNKLIDAMQRTSRWLCELVEGCKLAYVQSDEISLLLTDYDNLETQAWFDYNLQKMVSVSASIATQAFNSIYNVQTKQLPPAAFDARAFNIPEAEVCNYFIWRQQDATKNAIQMIGRHHLGHSSLQNLNGSQIQELLFTNKGINFNDLPTVWKRGTCVKKKDYDGVVKRSRWEIDTEIPIFTQDREYIENLLLYKQD